ncbi:hypothetical protein HNR46_001853 [Haloferula luteola]|uniref:Uncharacterized protein n=1 Tax=Haloferula luteola TaxID=595692 RepID=A0A840V3J5_9BACT|nr:hypothetical protein [Haloferula luteola]
MLTSAYTRFNGDKLAVHEPLAVGGLDLELDLIQ